MNFTLRISKICIALITGAIIFNPLAGQISYPAGSAMKYLKGPDAATIAADWNTASFDDASWTEGIMPIRYGDGEGGTVLDDMMNAYSVVYMRSGFEAQKTDSLQELRLLFNYDDGFVLWINGNEALRRNAPEVLSHDAFAGGQHESGSFEQAVIGTAGLGLVDGTNIIAVQAFNISLESTDFLFDLGIEASVPEPVIPPDPVLEDSVGLSFSAESGFFEETFFLEIRTSNPAWKVVYTLDGSNPQDSETAITGDSLVSIFIDPGSLNGRAATPAVTVRASSSSMEEGIRASYPEARTFIYLDEVLTQAYPGGEWPDYNVNGQIIDLPMDSRVVNSAAYRDKMKPALLDVPSISVVTDLDNLFGADSGIYVNAWGHGFEWERESSVELIMPDGSQGFNVNAGLRIRGGWSRHNYFSKHSFRLFFRSTYGDAKLNFPLFGDEGTDRYDKIDLRSAQNYSWHRGDDRNTFLRDVFSRDTQGDMGQPYTRSRYYHLYLNGMYWGLFQTQERAEARFAADYLGGTTDDYDVIKVNTEDWNYRIEVTDGSMDSWEDIWNRCSIGLGRNADYFALQGKNAVGEVNGSKVLVDIDNLIDYMMIIFYTANFDAPTSSFGGNQGPNNFFAIYNRENQTQGYTFYAHDAEHSLFTEGADLDTDINEDRVNMDDHRRGSMYVGDLSAFHPQWLHHKLTENQEYRVRFMDRAYRYMSGEGLLTRYKNESRLNRRMNEIVLAIIGESARWGDSSTGSPLTRDEHWAPEVEEIKNEFFARRGEIVIDQLDEGGLYTLLEPPVMRMDGYVLHDWEISTNTAKVLEVENVNGYGTMYYTTDGTDPRAVGGTLSSSATSVSELVSIDIPSSMVVKARVKYGTFWSALRELKVLGSQDDFSNLAITEIHYHPLPLIVGTDTTKSKDLEFLEFKNIGNDALNLSRLVLDSAIYYEFPEGSLLQGGEFHVLASKPADFYRRYGMLASGNYRKNLSNGGEEILLHDGEGTALMHFIYYDSIPWPMEPDGLGNSLVSVSQNPAGGNPAEHTYWRSSTNIGGSPFADDPFPLEVGPEILAATDVLLYPNPNPGMLYLKWSGDILPEDASLSLYGMNGQLLFQDNLHGNEGISLHHLGLQDGVYIVKITTPAQVIRKKIVLRK